MRGEDFEVVATGTQRTLDMKDLEIQRLTILVTELEDTVSEQDKMIRRATAALERTAERLEDLTKPQAG